MPSPPSTLQGEAIVHENDVVAAARFHLVGPAAHIDVIGEISASQYVGPAPPV
jgi:hypothetical protein